MTDEIRNLRNRLIVAHQESRIHPDEEHFKKWDSLIISTDAALVKAELKTKAIEDAMWHFQMI